MNVLILLPWIKSVCAEEENECVKECLLVWMRLVPSIPDEVECYICDLPIVLDTIVSWAVTSSRHYSLVWIQYIGLVC